MRRSRAQHGSLRRRKSGGSWTWLGTWWDDGHRRAKTLGRCSEMTKTEAQMALDQLVTPLNEQSGASAWTLQGFTRQVVFPWYRRSWKASTAMTTSDRQDHHILKELGNKPLSWFNRSVLQDFLDRKSASGLSQSTVAHLRWDLRQIFRMAVNDGLLQRNPAELLHAPKRSATKRPALTIQQLQTIHTVLDLRERLIVSLAGISGLRPGEVCGLKWTDIHPDGLHIERAIYRGIIQTPKTHHSIRTAAISLSIRADLEEWRNQARYRKPDDWIFACEHGRTPLAHGNVLRKRIQPALKPLGLGWVNFQVLRRTAVTLLNASGADATLVAAQCGHTVNVSINTYNRVGIQRQQEAINTLSNVITMPGRKAS
jgi:integrase